MELLFNYIQHGLTVPLSCSVTQIIIDSAVSTSKKGRNVQFIWFSVLCCCHRTPNKWHSYRGLHSENIFPHVVNLLIFAPAWLPEVRPVMQPALHSVPL